MTIEAFLQPAALISIAILFVLVLVRRVYRTLPLFVAYCGYSLINEVASVTTWRQGLEPYLMCWVITNALDTIFYLCVLVELGRNLLRHNKTTAYELLPAALLFILFCLAAWSLTSWTVDPAYSLPLKLVLFVVQILGTAPITGFLSLVIWSQLNRMNWPQRELRIATGMGSWALVAFVNAVLESHGLNTPEYPWVAYLTPFTCLAVVIYWIYSFWMEPGPTAEAGDAGRNTAIAKA